MSIDRLHELRIANPSNDSVLQDAMERGESMQDPLAQFLADSSQLRERISQLHRELTQLERSHRLATTDPSPQLFAQLTEATRSLQAEFSSTKSAYDRLTRFSFPPGSLNSSQQTVRANKLTNLGKALQSAVVIFSDIQHAFHKQQQQRIRRTIQTATGTDTAAVGNTSTVSYSQLAQVYDASLDQNAALILQDYRLRHEDLLAIEQGMQEIHAMFIELSQLVSVQGELIERIDNSTEDTTQYTEKGVIQIVGATKKAKLRRKLIIIGSVIALILLVLLLCYVINTFKCR